MEDLGIKKNSFLESGSAAVPNRDAPGTLEDLAKSFHDLVRKAGTTPGADLAGLAGSAAANVFFKQPGGLYNRPEPPRHDDDFNRNVKTTDPVDPRDSARNDRPHIERDRPDVSKPDLADRGQGDLQGNARESQSHRSTEKSDSGAQHGDGGQDKPGRADTRQSKTSDENDAAPHINGQKDASSTSKSKKHEEPTGITTDSQAAASINAATVNLASVLLSGQSGKGKSGQDETATGKSGQSLAATAGRTIAATGIVTPNSNQNQAATHNVKTTKGPDLPSQNSAELNAKSLSGTQQQGAELAKMINGAGKTDVKVSVNNDADTLSSKPTANMAAGTFLAAANAKSQTQNGNGQGTNHQSTTGQTNAQSIASAQAQAPVQQTAAQQNGNQPLQAQSGPPASSDAKGNAAGLLSGQGNSTGSGTAGSESSAVPSNATSSSSAAQQAQHALKSPAAQAAATNKAATLSQNVVDQINVKISKALQAGSDRISVQLKPAELGRVDVKMELGHDGRVLAIVTADNKDTLDLLRRDAGELQRALQDAGMQLDSSDLSFNLHGGEGNASDQDKMAPTSRSAMNDVSGDPDGIPAAAIIGDQTNSASDGRIDVKA